MERGDTLLEVFDRDPCRAADKIQELFVRLVSFFRWRHCALPEDLAQETLRRGFGRIRTNVTISTPDAAPYFFGIAHNVLREQRKIHYSEVAAGSEELLPLIEDTVDFRQVEVQICLEQCLQRLPDDERELLTRYYTEDSAALAREMRMSVSTLRVRAFRAKQKLEKWVRQSSFVAT